MAQVKTEAEKEKVGGKELRVDREGMPSISAT